MIKTKTKNYFTQLSLSKKVIHFFIPSCNKRKRWKISFKLLLLFFLIILGEIYCNKEKPIEPPPVDDNETSYFLYVGNYGGDEVFVVDTDSNAVVDTLRGFENHIWQLAVTKSGAKLYVCTREGPYNLPGKVFSVDLRTRVVSIIWYEVGDVYVAPDGTVIIIHHPPRTDLAPIGIVDTVSDAISFIDTLEIKDIIWNDLSVVFDKTRPLMYAFNQERELFSYDYLTHKLVRIYKNIYGYDEMAISPDGKTLYTGGGHIYDLENDSFICKINVWGPLFIDPKGEYIYFTDPGPSMIWMMPASGKINIVDTSTNSHIGYIDVNKVSDFTGPPTDRMVIKPEGTMAYVDNYANIYVIDLSKREVVNVIKFVPRNIFLKPIVIGKKLISYH